jgi:hypothetical protein
MVMELSVVVEVLGLGLLLASFLLVAKPYNRIRNANSTPR